MKNNSLRNIGIGHVFAGNEVTINDDNGCRVKYTFHEKKDAERFSGYKELSVNEWENIGGICGKNSVKNIELDIPHNMTLTEAIDTYTPEGTEYLDIRRYDPSENRTYSYKFNQNNNSFEIKEDGKIISNNINYDALKNRFDDKVHGAMKVREFLSALSDTKDGKKPVSIDPSYGNYYMERLSKPEFNEVYNPVRNPNERTQVTEIRRDSEDNSTVYVTLSELDSDGNIMDDSITAKITDSDASDPRISYITSLHFTKPENVLRVMELLYDTTDKPSIEEIKVVTSDLTEGLYKVSEINSGRFQSLPIAFTIETYGEENLIYNASIAGLTVTKDDEYISYCEGNIILETDVYKNELSEAMLHLGEALMEIDSGTVYEISAVERYVNIKNGIREENPEMLYEI